VSPGNFERLARLGEIVYLEADLDVMVERLLAEGGRPLLADTGEGNHNNRFDRLKNRLAALLDERAPVYARARYKVRTTALTPEQVAEAVMKLLRGTT
ncbi:MAG TPA: shikimate kinase, partial [Candidatus Obscuribacterales bacterium]